MKIERSKTVCFTGVRPDKLPDGGSRISKRIRALKRILYNEIVDSINEGCDVFMTGMQPGTELWAGEAVLELKNRYSVWLIAVIPYKGFGANYTDDVLWAFSRIMSGADAVVTVCENNVKGCGRMKNMFMLQQSSRIIGVAGDGHERTDAFRTLKYAADMGLDVICMDPGVMFYEAEKHLDINDPRHVLFNDYDIEVIRKGRGVARIAGRDLSADGNAPAEYDVVEISEETAKKITGDTEKSISAGTVPEIPEKYEDKSKEAGGRIYIEIPKKPGSKSAKTAGRKASDKAKSRTYEKSLTNTSEKGVDKTFANLAESAEKQPDNILENRVSEKKAPKIIIPNRPAAEPGYVKLEDIIDERYSAVMDDTLKLD